MATRIMPQAAIEPVRSQTGGVDARVEPVRDQSAGSLLAVGEGLTDVGRAVTVAADRAQDQVDIGMSLHLNGLYTEEDENEMDSPGTTRPDGTVIPPGFMTTQGKDATPERWKKSQERLRQKRQKLEAMAQNNTQKQNFAEHADRIDARSRSRANAHNVQEARVFESGERKAAADAGIREAIKFAGTEEGELARMTAMQHYDKWGELTGMPPSQLKNEKQKATDSYHVGVVGRIVEEANNPPMAKLYFDRFKGEMSPETELQVGRYIKKADVADRSTRAVLEMDSRGMAPDAQRAMADKAFSDGAIDATERDAIRARIEGHENDRDQARARGANESLKGAQEFAVLNRQTVTKFEALPPKMQQDLEQSGADSRMRIFLAQGGQWITTEKGLDVLLQARANPEKLRAYKSWDVLQSEMRHELSDEHLAELASKWQKANEPGKPSDGLSDGDINDKIRLSMIDAGILPSDRTPEPEESMRALRLETAIRKAAKASGGEAWKADKNLDAAIKSEMGKLIRDPDGNKRQIGSMSAAEMNAPGVGWETPSGVLVEAAAVEDWRRDVAVREIEERNADAAAFNVQRGYKPGDPRYVPPVEIGPQTIADEIGRGRAEFAEQRRKEAAAAREVLLREQQARWGHHRSKPLDGAFGSPWGRR